MPVIPAKAKNPGCDTHGFLAYAGITTGSIFASVNANQFRKERYLKEITNLRWEKLIHEDRQRIFSRHRANYELADCASEQQIH